MDGLLLLLRLILSGTFAVAGFTKLKDPQGTRQSFLDFGAPASIAGPAARLLSLAELLCAAAILPARLALWGAAGTLFLLIVFIAAISNSLAHGRRHACHCFGQLDAKPIGWTTIARNAVLAIIAAAVIFGARGRHLPGFRSWLSSLDRFETAVVAFFIALATLAALWAWSVVHLLRQNGRLMLRLEAIEVDLGLRPAPPEPGLPVGTPAPHFRVAALDGGIVTLDALRRLNETLLLIFVEPGCPGCDALMPDMAKWQRVYEGRFTIAVISRGSLESNRAKAAEHGIQNFLMQVGEETSHAYQAEGTPTAVLVRKGRIASHVAGGPDAIHALVEKAQLPPPLEKGELAPDVSLPDLDGQTVTLRGLRGIRHLLLFWNPDCGFCQGMLDDIKAWERETQDDAPRLLVISTGTPEANRAQGFRAPMVLDYGFQTGQQFGATGTPSAVLLDEQGHIASDVMVGAEAVMGLARGARVGLVVN